MKVLTMGSTAVICSPIKHDQIDYQKLGITYQEELEW